MEVRFAGSFIKALEMKSIAILLRIPLKLIYS